MTQKMILPISVTTDIVLSNYISLFSEMDELRRRSEERRRGGQVGRLRMLRRRMLLRRMM